MNSIEIAPQTIRSLNALASERNLDVHALADSLLQRYLQWHESEKTIIEERIRDADAGRTVAAEEVWKKLGLEH